MRSFFDGIFDGQGYTISNLTINGQAMFKRFAGTGNVTIKNVTFDNATVNSTAINSSILTVQSYQNVLLDNVDVKNSRLYARYDAASKGIRVGGLMGFLPSDGNPQTLIDCDVSNCEISGYHNVGAMIGTNYQPVTVTNCTASDSQLVERRRPSSA
jgi:hypothetical protein